MLNHRLNGFQIFIVIWLGQFVSLLGTAMTRFALLIWAYQQTGQATTLALLGFFSFVPYILGRPGLFGLLLIYVGMNLFATLTYFSILPAMVLARANNSELALAAVQSALGLGGVAGGFIASVWGGPKQRIHGILSGAALSFLLGDLLFALGRSAPAWSAAAFLAAFFIPFISSAHVAIWQAKVAPHVQGRVFSVKGVFQQSSMPLGYLLAGPLADRFFEPAMAPGGSLAGLFGGLVGTGPGAGMALMFLCTGLLGTSMGLSGYLFRPVREVEADLPDHEVAGGGQRMVGWAADG